MKYRKEEFRIIFEPIDTPERERAKKEAVSLLENLSNTELKDDFVLAGKIKVEPFCVVCKIKVDEKYVDDPFWDFEDADMSLLCSFIFEHIQYTRLFFYAGSLGDIYARTYLKSKVDYIGNRTGYRNHHPKILAYKPVIDEYFSLIRQSRFATDFSEKDDFSVIVDTLKIPEGIKNLNGYDGIFFFDDIQYRPKKIILSSTVNTIFSWEKGPVVDTGDNPYFKVIDNFFCNISEKSLLRYFGSEDKVTIPNFIKKIESYAFEESNITEIHIPASVKTIEHHAFINCKRLKSVEFSEGLELICSDAFFGCSNLKKVELPKSVCSINFSGSGLQECILQEGIKYLDHWDLLDCPLKKTYIPKTIKIIRNIPNGCEITVDKDNPTYEIRNKFLYDKEKDWCIQFGGKADELAVIPESTLLMRQCPENIFIPKNLTFSNKVFENFLDYEFEFDTVKTVQFEEGRTVLPKAAFKCSYDLQKITLPQSLTAIKRQAFFNCTSLPFIEIPPSVKTIEREAFLYCTSLEKIILPPNLRKLNRHIFAECKSLKEIAIPDSVRSIEMCAFYNCASLPSISLPQKLKTIGYRAFYGCSSLKEITLPESLTEIHEEAFANCKKLKTVYVYAGSYGEEFAKRLGLKIKILNTGDSNAL